MGGRKGGIDDGGPAYPVQNWLPTLGADEATRPHWGMSLRDWFAGQAMAALIPNSKANESAIAGAKKFDIPFTTAMAQVAYGFADAMLAERAKEPAP